MVNFKSTLFVLVLLTGSYAATVSGTVTDDNGSPVANANVKIYKSGIIDSVFTDAQGNYTTSDISLNNSTYAYGIKDGYHTGCTKVPNSGSPTVNIFMNNIMDYESVISPYMYGGNYYWSGQSYYSEFQSRVEAVTDVMRMGGCWMDACGRSWTTSYMDWFLDYCETIGAEPYVQVPVLRYDLSEVTDMMEHIKSSGHNVKYYSIGNEPERYYLDAGSQSQMTVEEYAEAYRERYHAIKEVDSSAIVCGFESIGEWFGEMLMSCGDIIDIFSIHGYPFDGSQTVYVTLGNPPNQESYYRQMKSACAVYGKREIPVAITEINLCYDHDISGDAGSSSFYAGLWWADVLGRLIKIKVYMTNIWCMIADQYLSIMDHNGTRRPTYWAQFLYKDGFYDQYVESTSDKSDCGAYVSKDESENMCVMVVNRNQTTDYTVDFDFASDKSNVIVKIPKLSIVRIKINDSGSITEIKKYTSSQGSSGPVTDNSLEKTSGADALITVEDAESGILSETGLKNTVINNLISVSPNPFSTAAEIRFHIQKPSAGLKAEVYDINGKRVKRFLQDVQGPGLKKVIWDGRTEQGNLASNGIYFIKITCGNQKLSHRLLLAR